MPRSSESFGVSLSVFDCNTLYVVPSTIRLTYFPARSVIFPEVVILYRLISVSACAICAVSVISGVMAAVKLAPSAHTTSKPPYPSDTVVSSIMHTVSLKSFRIVSVKLIIHTPFCIVSGVLRIELAMAPPYRRYCLNRLSSSRTHPKCFHC